MNTMLRTIGAVAALALAVPAFAQGTQAQPTGPRVGLGVSIDTLGFASAFTANTTALVSPKLYIPIVVAPNVRIEPEIGWVRARNDNDSTSDSAFDLGIGAMFLKSVNQNVDLYGGARLRVVWMRMEQVTGGGGFEKTEQRNFTFAPVIGGEYKPSPWFSVGVEAQLNFIFLGNEDITTTAPGGATVKTTGSGGDAQTLAGLAFLRVYFL
jgi:hypothetical protein